MEPASQTGSSDVPQAAPTAASGAQTPQAIVDVESGRVRKSQNPLAHCSLNVHVACGGRVPRSPHENAIPV
jgi:hypothetical protein